MYAVCPRIFVSQCSKLDCVVNLASPVGVVNVASPVGVVNLAPPVGVVNLASPVVRKREIRGQTTHAPVVDPSSAPPWN